MPCDVEIAIRPRPGSQPQPPSRAGYVRAGSSVSDDGDWQDRDSEYCVDVSTSHNSVSVKTKPNTEIWAHFGPFQHVFTMDQTNARVYNQAVRPRVQAFLNRSESSTFVNMCV